MRPKPENPCKKTVVCNGNVVHWRNVNSIFVFEEKSKVVGVEFSSLLSGKHFEIVLEKRFGLQIWTGFVCQNAQKWRCPLQRTLQESCYRVATTWFCNSKHNSSSYIWKKNAKIVYRKFQQGTRQLSGREKRWINLFIRKKSNLCDTLLVNLLINHRWPRWQICQKIKTNEIFKKRLRKFLNFLLQTSLYGIKHW